MHLNPAERHSLINFSVGNAPQAWHASVMDKRAEVAAKIPQEWRLSIELLNKVHSTSKAGVLDIPRKCGILSDKEIGITENYDAVALLKEIATGKLSSVEVTTAFCKRAAIAQQLTRCLTETFFDKAIQRANFLDKYFQTEGKLLGPLHGLPVSLKDLFNIKGIPSTLGYVSFLKHEPPSSNSTLVDILISLGAVLYVKTNVPQTLMSADTENNIFGQTLNPINLDLGPGGSSGGEGALIAMRGSLVGVGTDIGGSVRIPALCCGIFGFKPTTNRIPSGNQTRASKPGSPGIVPSAGILSTSARDIITLMEAVINSKPWNLDSSAISLPWRTVQPKSLLNIGVILEDHDIKVTPPVLRALRSAAEVLEKAGHSITVVRDFPSYEESNSLCLSFFDLDDDETAIKFITDSGEPMVTSIRTLYKSSPGGRQPKLVKDLFRLNMKRDKFKSDWNTLFVNGQFDVLLTPGAAHTALPHDLYTYAPYTTIWNLVDYPACIIPYSKADASIDVADPRLESYIPGDVDGAPTAIQVIGRHMEDEVLMANVEVIAKTLAR